MARKRCILPLSVASSFVSVSRSFITVPSLTSQSTTERRCVPKNTVVNPNPCGLVGLSLGGLWALGGREHAPQEEVSAAGDGSATSLELEGGGCKQLQHAFLIANGRD